MKEHDSMDNRHRKMKRLALSLALGVAIVGTLLAAWPSPVAMAQVGGTSEVSRVELSYTPDKGSLVARFTLASGLTLSQTVEDEQNIERLLTMADTFAQPKTRMFVTAERDRITSWHLSIP